MHGHDPAALVPFFAAITGAAAALAGLLFVAVSINLDNILKEAMLPPRAAETLAILVFILISSALALVPQDVELLGAEILIVAVPLTAITAWSQVKFRRQHRDSPLLWVVAWAVASGLALVPGMIAGASLTADWSGGFYWLVPTAVLGIGGAMYSARVLLVEIVR